MVDVRALAIPDVLEITSPKFGDDRGFFSETYNSAEFSASGIDLVFVQDNHSFSASSGVLRGLHYQLAPRAQDKLIRVVKGAIYDVAVDIRRSSSTFGKWVGAEISAAKWNQLFVPKGFAHGFVTLEPETEVIYKVTELYAPEFDRNIRFDDADLAIDWPVASDRIQLSKKDSEAPAFAVADVFQ